MDNTWLVGWKQIARKINCHIDTAKRWHKKYGMPIRRSPGGRPMAIPDELDRWLVLFSERRRDQGNRKL